MALTTGPNASSKAYPNFGTSCTFELQVDMTGKGAWKSYQKWSACAQPASPLMYNNPSNNSPEKDKTLQDPEFVTLDPRTLRFGAWGNAANQSTIAADYTDATDRPLILAGAFQNGVFQSVAELGHVCRAQPWKTLNFTSAMPTTSTTKARSADAGLLDVFTLHESSMEAGKTSLNTRQAPV